MDMIVEILYRAFEEERLRSDVLKTNLTDEYNQLIKKFHTSLSKEQIDLFHQIDAIELGFQIAGEKSAIRYLISLMLPDH